MGTAERNALAKAFLANSISAEEFKEKLTSSGLEISHYLQKLISDVDSGKSVRFFDFCKELEFLKLSKNFAPIQTLKANSHLSKYFPSIPFPSLPFPHSLLPFPHSFPSFPSFPPSFLPLPPSSLPFLPSLLLPFPSFIPFPPSLSSLLRLSFYLPPLFPPPSPP